eukprot:c16689_g1_i1.p1 GENE.c16689_g1_i1~~c16689_g1_i1.p1  ORF type:complete len:289 (+),score=62.01 c16689_g1_i1:32-868(+)
MEVWWWLSTVVILLASALGVAIPFVLPYFHFNSERIMRCTRCISAGVIVSVGLVHVLPEAHSDMQELSDYPWAYVIAMIGAFSVFILEQFLNHHHHHHPTESSPELARLHPTDDSELSTQEQYMVIAELMEVGIVFHSVIIGIGVGILEEHDEHSSLVIAIAFHQLLEGSGLSSFVLEARPTFARMLAMLGLFTFTCPTGVVVGHFISSTYSEHSKIGSGIQGSLNSFAAGILIHMGMVELIAGEFHRVRAKEFAVKVEMMCGIFTGAAVMSLLAVWA